MRHGGVFLAGGTVREDHSLAELEAAIEREIRKVQTEGVTSVELERAKIRTEVSRVRRLKSNIGQAFQIVGAVSTAGTLDYIQEYEKRLNAVTPDQVKAAAAKYLQASKKCVVELRKTKAEEGLEGTAGPDVAHKRGGSPGRRGEKHSTGFAEAMALSKAGKPITLKIPEIGKDVARAVLPGGMTVFVKEDHSAPSIDMSFAWLGGSNSVPVEELAPYELATQLLNEGGTEALDPIALSERTEELGMNFSIYLGATQSGGGFWSLKRNFRESFDLALDILMRPRFDAKRLETIKGQYVEQMKQRNESPGRGASLLLWHVLDGDHPRLGYTASRKEIEAVTPDQVRRAWKRHLGRDNLYLTVVGDFESKEMLGVIQAAFSGWRPAEDRERKWITREPVSRPGVHLLEKEFPQPAVRLTHQIKLDRTAPEEDHAAVEILNDILGGSGFRSRLMERLRSDEGLTYGIYSYIAHDGRPGEPGRVGISYQTKKASVARSIDSVLEEFGRIIAEDVTAAEVEEQIEAWRNQFVFRYESEFFSVARLMANELDDRPYDYDRRELDSIQKVTVTDVRRAASRYLKPENLSIAIYGVLAEEDRAKLKEKFGDVKIYSAGDVFKGGYEEKPPGS